MAKNLVIVESPAKAKTIEKFLGKDFEVLSSYGHIRDLKKKDFSVDIEHNYKPIYEIPADKKKLVETLKQGAIDAALASERSIVDVETLKKINEDIITSINEVVKIHEEGSQKRVEAQEELVKIETELKDALLKAGSR